MSAERSENTKLVRRKFVGFPIGLNQAYVFDPESRPTPATPHDAEPNTELTEQTEPVEPTKEVVLLGEEDRAIEG